ncbi:hypothetical protein T11_18414 [Trichinella zimbabwensis]|uniref:Uncharacterized protein n=1 Tax=Trichinella zimbabwensis TaxID=268475 RepID=A0A0V1GBT4_9BILA|nr:hypothetical protein T11_18414 [Trichinella zimbabwensis]
MEKFDKKDFPNFGNLDFSKFLQFSKFQNFFSRQPRMHLK